MRVTPKQDMFESVKAAHSAVKIGFFVSSLTIASLGARLAAADGSPDAAATALGVSVAHRIAGDLSDESLKRLVEANENDLFSRHDPQAHGPRGSDLLQLFEAGPPPKLDVSPATAAVLNDARPLSGEPNPAARPFVFKGSSADREAATTCLTQAVYYEAGFEPIEGARSVAQVVLNRVRHPIFPKTVCGVVFQGADLRTGCQFSFACDGSLAKTPAAGAYARARKVAEAALAGFVEKDVGEATHYHTQWVLPWWSPTVSKVAKVGSQIFYRWPGALGLPAAFTGRYTGSEPVRGAQAAATALSQTAIAQTGLPAEAADQPATVHMVTTAPAPQVTAASAPIVSKPSPSIVETASLLTEAPDLKVRTAPAPSAPGQAFYSCSAGPCRRW